MPEKRSDRVIQCWVKHPNADTRHMVVFELSDDDFREISLTPEEEQDDLVGDLAMIALWDHSEHGWEFVQVEEGE
jgi:hypothetical protein